MGQSEETPKPDGLGIRHIQYFLMFLCITVSYAMRIVPHVAIVAMTKNHTIRTDYLTYPEWRDEKNIILSSFFWGYVCLQIGAGELSKNYGPKKFLALSLFITSLMSTLIPVSGELFGYGGVIACRVIQGIFQGFLFPSCHILLSQWAPVGDRAKWVGLVYSSTGLAVPVSMPLTGLICGSKFGWPMAFYVFGCIGFAWCVLWIIIGADSPSKCTRISNAERQWIENGTKVIDYKKSPTPWKSILTSLPFIAVIVSHCGFNWGYWTLIIELPSYMNSILNFSIQSNGELSSLPYIAMFAVSLIASPIADLVIKKKLVSLEASRKIFNSVGFFVPALSLIVLCLVGGGNKDLVIIILIIAVATNACSFCGFCASHLDLAPAHAGPLMGITICTATFVSIFAPLCVDVIRYVTGLKEANEALWNIVFYFSAGVYIFCGIFFVIFGSGEIQPWNYESGIKNTAVVQTSQEKTVTNLNEI